MIDKITMKSVFVFTIVLWVSCVSAQKKTVLLNTVHRHGDRTVISFYPKDPWSALKYWPDGLGQVTEVGKEQLYKLGAFIRTKYDALLPKNYHPRDVYVRSTNTDRTLTSAQAVMLGVYQNRSCASKIPYQIVPVHTIKKSTDKLLRFSATCPKAKSELNRVLARVQKDMPQYDDVLQILSKNTGFNIRNVADVADVYGTLYIEELKGYKLPAWTKSVYPKRMTEMNQIWYGITCYSDLLRRLRGGPLVKEMISRMVQKAQGKQVQSWYEYSGHDHSVSTVLCTLGVYDKVWPDYTSTVFVELIQEGGKNFVQVSYKNPPAADRVLQIKGCDKLCPLDKFQQLMKPFLPGDWTAECQD